MKQIVLIAHNLRSCHNVGSLLRTAEALGVARVILTGYTPYPLMKNDPRMPHVARKIHKQIVKTALGAEKYLAWSHHPSIDDAVHELRAAGFSIFAVEQAANSTALPNFRSPEKLALIVGREVEGIEDDVLRLCDGCLEIPMLGKKESLNVVQAAAIALYHCTFE